jgi:ABC-type Na+ efflux pump permease subunit
MNEIARLQATLQESLLYQEATIERLSEDAELTVDMVRKGNVMLHRAANNQSSFRNVMVVLIFVLTFVMLFLHYYSD